MDNTKFNILSYCIQTEKPSLGSIQKEFNYDITEQEFANALNYLFGKNYIQSSENGVFIEVTEKGERFHNAIMEEKIATQRKTLLQEKLQTENLQLQNENMNYQKNLREMEMENLRLQNRQLKREFWIGILSASFGAILSLIGQYLLN